MTPPVWSQVVSQERAERIDDAVRSILDNPPYVEEPSLLERILQWLAERGIFDAALDDTTLGIVNLVVQLLVVAIVVALVWLVVRRVRTGAFLPSRRGGPRVEHLAADRSAADWLRDARRAAAEGRNRDAVRAAYRAIVVQLVDRGVLPDTPGATVGAHRESLARSAVLADLQARGFTAASDVFEAVWYGDRDADDEDVAVVVGAADRVGVAA